MKGIVFGLVALAALLVASKPATAHGPYRGGFRVAVYAPYRPYYGVYRPYPAPFYVPPPGYYAPYPVYGYGPPMYLPPAPYAFAR